MTLPQFRLSLEPIADPTAVVTVGRARFTVLTSRLLRIEYSPTGQFEDRASQAFWYRRQAVPPFRIAQIRGGIEIVTDDLHLRYHGGPFTRRSLSVKLLASGRVWRPGDTPQQADNLLGTARTLDDVSGETVLEPGLMSRGGWAVVDDSRSLVFADDGWLEPRHEARNRDLYFFGYAQDYAGCLADFTRVCGPYPSSHAGRWATGGAATGRIRRTNCRV